MLPRISSDLSRREQLFACKSIFTKSVKSNNRIYSLSMKQCFFNRPIMYTSTNFTDLSENDENTKHKYLHPFNVRGNSSIRKTRIANELKFSCRSLWKDRPCRKNSLVDDARRKCPRCRIFVHSNSRRIIKVPLCE